MFSRTFFGSHFFGPSYFGSSTSTSPPVTAAKFRDTDILVEIVRLLKATDQFGSVWLCGMEEYQRSGAEETSIAFVDPESWTEDTDADDEDGPRERRDVIWSLTIVVKDDDPQRRNQRLDQLANVAMNTLNGVSYLGQTVRPWSRLTNGRYSAANHPYKFMEITGKFTLLLDDYDGNDDADNLELML